MYESSGSQFFRTIIGIELGPDAFDESKFIRTFLIILKAMQFQTTCRKENR